MDGSVVVERVCELPVSDNARQELHEVRGLNHGAAILAMRQRAKVGVPGDLDRTVACRTRVGRREPATTNLVNQAVHVDLYLRHDISLRVPPRFARLLPHSEALEDLRGILEPFRLEEVAR